jgi:hypothetical protein
MALMILGMIRGYLTLYQCTIPQSNNKSYIHVFLILLSQFTTYKYSKFTSLAHTHTNKKIAVRNF